ncbi:MAG: hypothetical protein PHZ09_08525 [Eubacteriales bacterium]|nr:hypothetical protein [Eubacteriales bacterium]
MNIGITAYQYRDDFTADSRLIRETRESMLELYFSDTDEYQRLKEDYLARLADYEASQYKAMFGNTDKARAVFENKLIDLAQYGDRQLFSDIERIINTQDRYRSSILSLLRDSALRIQEVGDSGGYLYEYYADLLRLYDPYTDLSLPAAEIRGWNEYFSLQTPLIFLALASLGLFCGVFRADSHAGMCGILRVCKRGGRETTGAKLSYIVLTSAVIIIIFTLSPLLIFALSSGLSEGGAPIQMLDIFTYCRYNFTVGQYLLIYTVVRIIIFTCFNLAIAVLGQYTDNEAPAFVLTAVIAGIGAALSSVSPSSFYYFLQKFSILEIANVNILFTRYRGLNIFDNCADYTVVILISALLLITVFITGALLHRPAPAIRVRRENKRSATVFNPLSLFSAEGYKHMICGSGFLILAASFVLKCIMSGIYYDPHINSSEMIYMDYIARVAGPVTDDNLSYIENEKNYIDSTLNQYSSAVEAFGNGKITIDEYRDYMNRYNYAFYCRHACDRLCDRRDYLVGIADSRPGVEFIYEEGIDRYLAAPLDIVMVLTTVFMCGNIFAFEYDSGFSKILRLSKRGRKPVYRRKLIFSLTLAAAVYLIFSGIDLYFLLTNYNVNYLSVNIISMPRFADIAVDMSIGTYVILYKIVTAIGSMLLFVFVTVISGIFENRVKTMVVSTLAVFIPYVTDKYGVSVLNAVSAANFMAPLNVFNALPTYLVCTGAVIVLNHIMYVKWYGRGYKR